MKDKKNGIASNGSKKGKQTSSKRRASSSYDEDNDLSLFLNAVCNADAAACKNHDGYKDSVSPKNDLESAENNFFQKAMEKMGKKKQIRTKCSSAEPVAPLSVDKETKITDADTDEFMTAMGNVVPLAGKGRSVALEPNPSCSPMPTEIGMQDVLDGKFEFALSMTGEYLEGFVVGLAETTLNKLRAGSYSPEAHLDLHGLNANQAFEALLGFIRSSWFKGLRTVLVIPGRGLNSPNGIGILRERLQMWLTQEPFKRVVLAFCTACPADGGPGSVYVMLRKYKKKGKIIWDCMPSDPDLL